MFLSKEAIKKAIEQGEIGISNFKEENLKPASYTLTLDTEGKENCILDPGQFALLNTKEKVTLNGKLCGILATPSRLAQKGIDVTQGSDFVEPDTDNTFILETSNSGNTSVTLTEGMKIVKIAFVRLEN